MPPKRRRRFQGLYYHSSPPKVIPMNGQTANQNDRKRRDLDEFSVKLSTIRIWMHEKDIGKLTRILWAGQGNRLRQQASTNSKVKRFLAAVPYVMNAIKEIHQAVVDNNLETLQAKLEPPVPPALVTCKDANGLNVIHKAAGLGHTKMLEYLIGVWPDGAHETDITGKTALHWAASAKNNMRCYTLLTNAGCDEEAMDYKMKTPSYYRHKPHEIERAFLVFVPEAPRVSPDVATDWEALSDDSGDGKKLDIKIPDINGFNGNGNVDSIENTSEADLIDGISVSAEDEMSNTDEVAIVDNDKESVPATPDDTNESNADDANEEDQLEDNNPAEDENNTRSVSETAVEATVLENGVDNNDNAAKEENEVENKDSETVEIAEENYSDALENVDDVKIEDNVETEENNENENTPVEIVDVEQENQVEDNDELGDQEKQNNENELQNEKVEEVETNNSVEENNENNESFENDESDKSQADDETNKTEEHTNTDEEQEESAVAETSADPEYNVDNKLLQQDMETGEKTCVTVSDANGNDDPEGPEENENANENDGETVKETTTPAQTENSEIDKNGDGTGDNVSVENDVDVDENANSENKVSEGAKTEEIAQDVELPAKQTESDVEDDEDEVQIGTL